MQIKLLLKLITTLIFIFILILISFIYLPEINSKYYSEIKKITSEIDLKIMNNKTDQIDNTYIPENTIFAFWIQNKNKTWVPLMIDNRVLNENEVHVGINIPQIPDKLKYITKELIFNDNQSSNNYLIWLNRYNYDFILKNIFLMILFLILCFLLIILFIELLFSQKGYVKQTEATSGKNVISSETSDSGNLKSNETIIDEYKKLWSKNFKISDDFKNSFPFFEIFNLVRLSTKPDEYIKYSLKIASTYFKWNNPKIYIRQNDKFIDAVSNEVINDTIINPAEGSNRKKDVFIPLYPYGKNTVFGYFYFYWDEQKNWNPADILYFLKFIFSDQAKFIFSFSNDFEKIVNLLSEKLNNDSETYFCLLQVDHIDRINKNLNALQKDILNNKIKETISLKFTNTGLYQADQLFYILIGTNPQKEAQILQFKNFISNRECQNFNIDPDYGNIAVTYSCGTAFKNKRNIHAISLIKEAEDNIKKVEKNGGNSIIFT